MKTNTSTTAAAAAAAALVAATATRRAAMLELLSELLSADAGDKAALNAAYEAADAACKKAHRAWVAAQPPRKSPEDVLLDSIFGNK